MMTMIVMRMRMKSMGSKMNVNMMMKIAKMTKNRKMGKNLMRMKKRNRWSAKS
jgi:hypothetical protein